MAGIHVVFVCRGNICRSPTAHAVLQRRVRQLGWDARVRVDSAGTRDWHAGEPPDPRSRHHASLRGYDLADLRARALRGVDFERADLVLAMDDENLDELRRRCPAQHAHKLHRFVAFCRRHAVDGVIDPYDGDATDFEHALDVIEDACEGLIEYLQPRLPPR